MFSGRHVHCIEHAPDFVWCSNYIIQDSCWRWLLFYHTSWLILLLIACSLCKPGISSLLNFFIKSHNFTFTPWNTSVAHSSSQGTWPTISPCINLHTNLYSAPTNRLSLHSDHVEYKVTSKKIVCMSPLQGCHMVKGDWTECPVCRFPALYSEFKR